MRSVAARLATKALPLGSAAALAAVALAVPGALRARAGPMDEGVLLLYPRLIRDGHMPYRDFRFLYGPAQSWVLAALPNSLFTERVAGIVCRVMIAVGIYVLVRRRSTDLALPAAALSFAFAIGSGGFAWWYALPLLIAAIVFAEREQFVLAGVCAGAAVLFRFDLAPAALAIGLLGERRRVVDFARGAAIPAALMLLQIALSGVDAFLQSTLFDELRQADERRLGLPSGPALWALVLIGASVARLLATKDRDQRRIAVVAALMLVTVAQRADDIHVAYVAAFVVPVALATLYRVDRVIVTLAVGAAFLATPMRWIGAHDAMTLGMRPADGSPLSYDGKRWIAGSDADARTIRTVVKAAATLPGCTLFVGPSDLRFANYNDTFIYWLLYDDLKPTTPYLELNPGIANRDGSGLREHVLRADVVVLNQALDPGRTMRPHAGPDVRRSLVRSHKLVREYGTYELFARQDVRACETS